MEELREGTQTVLQGGEADHKVFSYPLPFNLIPQIDSFQA
jgi:aspartate-semialdehyde dehydrogenase